jgi:hypothetical protein
MERMKMKMKLKSSGSTRVLVTYRPATHNGRKNTNGKAHTYEVLVHGPFENIAKKESFAGFSALHLKDGKWKRFRMNRIVCMVQLEKEAA